MKKLIKIMLEDLGWFGVSILVVITILIHSFLMMLLWDWFVVKTFDLNPLSIQQAFGIVLTFNFLTKQYVPKRNLEERVNSIEYSILVMPAFSLIFGFLVHLAMI